MANKKENRWRDIDGGSAFVIPYTVLRHPNFIRLSPYAHKLLHDLASQYTGFNNGYQCSSWVLMKDRGWRSTETLWRTIRELEHYNIIVRTQQGGKHKANLHAFTFHRIDSKPNQPLEVSQTLQPKNEWKFEQPPFDLKIVHTKRRTSKRLLKAA